MEKENEAKLRQYKLDNGEIIKVTDEEFQRVVDVFKILLDTDRRILLDAVDGSKVGLVPLRTDQIKKYVGKKVFISIRVKEELQSKHWDFYYKLESVTLDSYSSKKKTVTVKNLKRESVEIEARDLFVEVEPTESKEPVSPVGTVMETE